MRIRCYGSSWLAGFQFKYAKERAGYRATVLGNDVLYTDLALLVRATV